ncbi:hypothetical protein CCHR01_02848 [Colletotrichum chrysophilum]|uniref:Uncharacterized protein n=1 Tax=Colletotrichum chrysophilum TaxID=1836956 RepID=A0AAD9ATW2_9PEZI|nr:hypothetical protein CCHR01_02848 [Colletotrichum chrysophilum]
MKEKSNWNRNTWFERLQLLCPESGVWPDWSFSATAPGCDPAWAPLFTGNLINDWAGLQSCKAHGEKSKSPMHRAKKDMESPNRSARYERSLINPLCALLLPLANCDGWPQLRDSAVTSSSLQQNLAIAKQSKSQYQQPSFNLKDTHKRDGLAASRRSSDGSRIRRRMAEGCQSLPPPIATDWPLHESCHGNGSQMEAVELRFTKRQQTASKTPSSPNVASTPASPVFMKRKEPRLDVWRLVVCQMVHIAASKAMQPAVMGRVNQETEEEGDAGLSLSPHLNLHLMAKISRYVRAGVRAVSRAVHHTGNPAAETPSRASTILRLMTAFWGSRNLAAR